ncbi:heterokaryon incompatibility protein-domain-containing protein [Sordaria brevicollis]|uniref:Heterokaryon incompatibility protein-domain-containing protein n=1 Tax=Sordaria brevicollis TaxID=83679 RepID=A0AAE0UAR0_SORBR|nr:heterokaryon incompatibility protein-domain-containing protein [Sordaria brevicollis]
MSSGLSSDPERHEGQSLSPSGTTQLSSTDCKMPENSIGTYPYQPLQSDRHIRLLLLNPPATSTPQGSPLISATLHQYRLGGGYVLIACDDPTITFVTPPLCPRYKALSYEWGPPPSNLSDSPVVLLDNHPTHVRQNLYNALESIIRNHHHIYGESLLYLWVDAICINQLDDKEKGHQVRLMRDIYMDAEQVIIWLGMGTDYTERVMEIINMEERELRRYAWNSKLTEKEWEGIVDIYCKPTYWTRVWILQEFFLASNYVVLCNNAFVAKANFERGLEILQQNARSYVLRSHSYQQNVAWGSISHWALMLFGDIAVKRVIFLRSARWPGMKTVDKWLDVLYKHKSKATDPRDYVFAVLGISDDGEQITPDYELSTSDVYLVALLTYAASDRIVSDAKDDDSDPDSGPENWAELMGVPEDEASWPIPYQN